jgi:hypothetical protein
MYTDYDSEIYFLTDPHLTSRGVDSGSAVPTYLGTGSKMEAQDHSGFALGFMQQPDINIIPRGDQK